MAGPLQPGSTDGQTVDHKDETGVRTWTWVAADHTWIPVLPRPYEVVRSSTGERRMYHPHSQSWFDPLHFPEEFDERHPGSVLGTIRNEDFRILHNEDKDFGTVRNNKE